MTAKIEEYRRRRDFDHTPEPRGSDEPAPGDHTPIFALQKHDAIHPHHDLLIEVDGVLKAWVVPDGPPHDPHEQRLALQMENHPLEYAAFEGEIPPDQYNAGTVKLNDRGICEYLTRRNGAEVSPTAAITDGHLVVRLHGDVMRGIYALDRIEQSAEPRWVLVKTDQE